MRFTHHAGWIDDDAILRQAREAGAAELKRLADYAEAVAQANAPETIPPTGKHHRSDGT